MTREEATKELTRLADNPDTETAHIEADGVLCQLLAALGFQDVVDAYERINKWYA